MTRSRFTQLATRGALMLALVMALTAAGPAAFARPSNGGDVIWLKVEIHDASSDRAHVKVNVPLSLIEVVIDSIDKREFMASIQHEHPSLDLPKLWHEVRDMRGADFVTVETDKENVRVWKDDDFFRIDVEKGEDGDTDIEVKLPLAIMDYMFESKVSRLQGHLPVTIVQMHDEDHSVKIWLEQL